GRGPGTDARAARPLRPRPGLAHPPGPRPGDLRGRAGPADRGAGGPRLVARDRARPRAWPARPDHRLPGQGGRGARPAAPRPPRPRPRAERALRALGAADDQRPGAPPRGGPRRAPRARRPAPPRARPWRGRRALRPHRGDQTRGLAPPGLADRAKWPSHSHHDPLFMTADPPSTQGPRRLFRFTPFDAPPAKTVALLAYHRFTRPTRDVVMVSM